MAVFYYEEHSAENEIKKADTIANIKEAYAGTIIGQKRIAPGYNVLMIQPFEGKSVRLVHTCKNKKMIEELGIIAE